MNRSYIKTALIGAALFTQYLLPDRVFAQEQPAPAAADAGGKAEPSEPAASEAAPVPSPNDPAAPAATTEPVAPEATAAAPQPAQLPDVVVEQPVKADAAKKKAVKRKTAAAPEPAAAKSATPAAKATAKQTPVQQTQPALADASTTVPDEQDTAGISTPISGTILSEPRIAQSRPRSSDAASLLSGTAGVSLAQGGGVSSLPAINGLADDRVKIKINGREATSACGNHMNPPLSYADGAQVKRIRVMPGSAPVSEGGDAIGGVINVETLPPAFAEPGGGPMAHAAVSSVYRSNGDGLSTSASAHAAAGNMSMAYTGAFTRANNYEDGSGRAIGSTEYEAHNHTLALAARHDSGVYVLEGGVQHIPYQGFVNQPMDMVLNDSFNIAGRYEGTLDWGKLTLGTSYQHVRHGMNFLKDKLASFEAAGFGANNTMPMDTRGDEGGYTAKAEINLGPNDTVRIGNELHLQRLDDRWPAVCFSTYCGMGPDTYVNINGGTRDRAGTFLEWQHTWDKAWSTLFGVRNDVVRMDSGDVQPYERIDGDIDTAAADAFNAKEHARTDVNFDWSGLVRYEAAREVTLEAAASRKTRSPNLYERYAWGESSMTSQMTTWFGDANGYAGNLDLEPEVAHRLSFSAGLHDADRKSFELTLTPFYTRVDDFITAELYAEPGWVNGFNQLKFVNHDATLYGIDISGRALLAQGTFGRVSVSGVASYVRGEDRETQTALYHMMPWNGRLALEHTLAGLTTIAEVELVGAKSRVDEARLEPMTNGYTLLNLRSSYTWENMRFDMGVENVFDTLYFAPLGGTNYTDYLLPGHAVAGAGRSFIAGLTVNF